MNGNLVSKQEKGFGKVWNYSYSSENQLLVAEYFDNNIRIRRVDMIYDALGRRIQKKVLENSETKVRKYVFDGNEIIAELNDNSDVLVKYTHSGQRTDDVLAMDVTSSGAAEGFAPNTGTFYFLKDGLGSIIDITNSSGSIVQHYSYSSFGTLLKIENGGVDNTANPAIKQPFTYTNREFDPELGGLYYYRARYYDSHSGRFMQEDTHAGILGLPISLNNKYVYAHNNSLNLIDADGRFPWMLFILGAVISAGSALDSGSKSLDENGNRRGFSADVIWGAFVSGVIGGFQGSLGGLTGWSSLLAIPFSAALVSANNITNQLIFTGKVGDWGSVGKAAGGGTQWGALSTGLAGANYILTGVATIGYGVLVSIPATQNNESGIPDSNKIDCSIDVNNYACRL